MNGTNYEGNTAVHMIFRCVHSSATCKLSKPLLIAGAKVNMENNGCETAIIKCKDIKIQTCFLQENKTCSISQEELKII